MQSLGTAVWGIQQGICPQDSCLQSALILGLSVLLHPLLKKKMQIIFSPLRCIPAPVIFMFSHPNSSPAARNECLSPRKTYICLSGATAFPCLVRFISMANFGLTRCVGVRSVADCVGCAALKDRYKGLFAGTWKKNQKILTTLELNKITQRALLTASSAPAGTNCIMPEQKARP